ncbi:MAG: FtsX-like permease family protein [Bacteroidota bacterium]
MLKNHLKFAVRMFLKDGIYPWLNVLGLSLGISCGILVLLYLQYDLTYDQHHKNHKNIYRIVNHLQATGASFNVCSTARELAPLLANDYAEIENYVRFNPFYNPMLKHTSENGEETMEYIERVYETDSSVLSVFTHQFIEGDPNTALDAPNKMIITDKVARIFFGAESALNKQIVIDDGEPYEVTGVIEELPGNTHLKYDVLVSQMPLDRDWIREGREDPVRVSEGFWNPDSYSYLLFNENYDADDFYHQFPQIYETYFKGFGDKIEGKADFDLEPLLDIHFRSNKDGDVEQGNINYTYTFAAIGLFIILLACINYVNMATSRAVNRASEIGMRKALGHTRAKLFSSILLEAFVIACLALLLAIIICVIIIYATPLETLLGKELRLDFLGNPTLIFGSLFLTVFIALVSGFYPALYLPSIPIVKALKGKFSSQSGGRVLRKSLIVFQFVISIFVIICTYLMEQQIEFLRNTDLGFNSENVVLIPIQDSLVINQMEAIKTEYERLPGVVRASTAYGVPGKGVGSSVFRVEQPDGAMTQQNVNTLWAGEEYLETMGIELLAGRGLKQGDDVEVRLKVIVNEAMVRVMQWGDSAVGKKIKFFHAEEDGEVIGVMKDFNYNSLHNKVEPLLIGLSDNAGGYLHLRVLPENLTQTMSEIEDMWKEFDPNHPYQYDFLDQNFNEQYKADEIQQRLVGTLSYVCIFISILGLIGLAAFTAGQKTKEIGVRKVLGASSDSIIRLFSKDYIKLIIIAFIIAVPVANYVISEWLNSFAYQVDIKWYNFLIPGLIVLIVAMLTVGLQTLKSANANPATALRSE